MEHPLLDPSVLNEKSVEDLEKTIADLSNKLRFARSSAYGAPMVGQIEMVLDSYKTILNRKLDEKYNQQGNNNPYTTTIDITK
jgi:hypothetical protein